MEINLSLPELEAILDAERKRQYAQNKFLAALKGINLGAEAAESAEDKIQAVKNRVAAKLSGMDEEEYELQTLGLGFEIEEE